MRTAILSLFLFVSIIGYSQNYRVGEAVEVLVEDVWFDAYILEVNGKKLRLNYSRISDKTDFWVKETDVRRKVKKGDGSGSVTFKQTTGAPPQKIDKPNSKRTENKESTTTKQITLHNTCSRKETFVINEVEYEVEGYKKIELQIPIGTSIYSLENNKKMIRGKVSESITVFRPNCN